MAPMNRLGCSRPKGIWELDKLLPIRQRCASGKGLNNYAVVKHITIPGYQLGAPCFARLLDPPQGVVRPTQWFVDYPFARRFGPGVRIFTKPEAAYMKWLTRESAWAPAFLTKNLDSIARNGIVYSTAFPAKYVVQAAILARSLGEWPDIIRGWNETVPYTDPHMALVLAHMLRYTDKGDFECVGTNGGHQAWECMCMGKDTVKRMMDHRPIFDGLPLMCDSHIYRNMSTIWNGNSMDLWHSRSKAPFTIPPATCKRVEKIKLFGGQQKIVRHTWNTPEEFVNAFLKRNRLEKLCLKTSS